MKDYNNTKIIGIDHGYGNIKTANCCFGTGILASDKEPICNKQKLHGIRQSLLQSTLILSRKIPTFIKQPRK